MGILHFLGGNKAVSAGDPVAPAKRDATDDFWFEKRGTTTYAKVRVTVEGARQVPVVRDCLNVLCGTASSLSFGVFEWQGQDNRRRRDDHPFMRLMMRPSQRQTAFDLVYSMVDDLAASGFFLGRLQFGGAGVITGIDRIDPKYVTDIELLPDETLRFSVQRPGRPMMTLLEDECWYIPVPPFCDEYLGRSAILHDGAEAIGALMGMHNYANAFWGNDATPPLIFHYDGYFKEEKDKSNFLNAWRKLLTGRRRGSPGILEHGIKVEQLGNTLEQNQFLDTRKELQLDACRLWRMQPHKVGILDRATFSNIEQQSLEFVVDTMLPWLRLIERSAHARFLGGGDGRGDIYFQFNVASLLRGDTASRFKSYQLGRQWGWMSVNEIRAMENMNGIGPEG